MACRYTSHISDINRYNDSGEILEFGHVILDGNMPWSEYMEDLKHTYKYRRLRYKQWQFKHLRRKYDLLYNAMMKAMMRVTNK